MAPLETLGFALAGYGCTTCIGNSGPLDDADRRRRSRSNDLVVAAVLSGNRNFEGRIHPLARASYLASPPLVVAFALAGRVDIDLTTEPLGTGSDGAPVFLADIWPASDEIRAVIGDSIDPELFRRTYAVVFEGDERWQSAADPRRRPLRLGRGLDVHRQAAVLRRPDARRRAPVADIDGARVLAVLGDSVTTDHISPAGSIAACVARRGVAPGARRRAARVQLVRRPARPPRGDDAGHVREHPPAQPARRGPRRAVHGPPPGRRGAVHLRRRDALPGRGRPAPRHRRPRVRLRARRATGRRRAPRSSGSRRSSPRATSGSTARTSSGWACCRSSSCPARAPRRWD